MIYTRFRGLKAITVALFLLAALPGMLLAAGSVSISPDPAQAGSNVTVTYNPSGGPLTSASSVTIHRGINGWQNVEDVAMSQSGSNWVITYSVPSNATQLDMVFHEGGTWDNNNGSDWHFTVQAQPTPTPIPNQVAISPDPAPAGGSVTVLYDPASGPLAGHSSVNIHHGYDGWSGVSDVAMSQNVDGFWEVTYTVNASATSSIDMVFYDGGTWDNNGGNDWHFSVSTGPTPTPTATPTPTDSPTPSPTPTASPTPSPTPTPTDTPTPTPTATPYWSGNGWMGRMKVYDPNVWGGGRDANYGVAKYYIDEDANESVPLTVTVDVWTDGVPHENIEVEVFTNLNRRDYAKTYEPLEDINQANSYYVTVPMSFVEQVGNDYVYMATMNVDTCGVYRVTTRWRAQGYDWQWHNQYLPGDGTTIHQRDCNIVVSPEKVLDLSIYEVNSLNVEATSSDSGGRSTFEDFTDHDTDGYDPFNLNYVKNTLGFNTIWMMPIHPITTQRWYPSGDFLAQNGSVGSNISPGSPYATRNYWEVNEMLSDEWTWADSLSEFQYVVNQAENMGLNIFIDVAMNHAGWDVMYGQGAVDLGYCTSGQEFDEIRSNRSSWVTKRSDWYAGNYGYRQPATSYNDCATWAPGDQQNRHQWFDAGVDWYFGDYNHLGFGYPYSDGIGWFEDERDEFWTWTDTNTSQSTKDEVARVWNYFAYYVPYWLNQTGNKLDGIRADFAQGLPAPAWEYIINKTRQSKWDFVFLAEVLDEPHTRYRTSRHFDLMTTVDHYLYRKGDLTMTQLVGSLDSESSAYGYNVAVMHNGSSHDESPGGAGAWMMAARYAVASSLYGVPMAYMGQPLGVPDKIAFDVWSDMKYYWDNNNDSTRNALYKKINDARANHAALRSTNRYFLGTQSTGGFNDQIYAAARWEGSDVMLVFINLREWNVGSESYNIPSVLPLGDSTMYQAYNLTGDPNTPLWGSARSGADIKANGMTVGFNYGNEIQYIELRAQ
ncbi:hypothetical protein KQI84_12625 [bacterium]|nr:hypothetical protein [bacterium]